MNVEREAQTDLSLDPDAAESVAGGRAVKQQTKHTAHRATAPSASAPTAPIVTTSAGLGMGPDPGYPNADNGESDSC
jgi:hypothetical protein